MSKGENFWKDKADAKAADTKATVYLWRSAVLLPNGKDRGYLFEVNTEKPTAEQAAAGWEVYYTAHGEGERRHGGAREGSGRKPTGRKARNVRATDEEFELIQDVVAQIRAHAGALPDKIQVNFIYGGMKQ